MQLLRYGLQIVLPLASAVPWDGPQLTQVSIAHDIANGGWSPAPTAKPGALFGGFELKERQFLDATCGFISGSTSRSYTCFQGAASCVLDNVHSIFGCCEALSSCQLPTSCVPHSQIASCDTDCAGNPFIFKCDTDLPYCNEYILSTGTVLATAWYCSDTPYIETMFLSAVDGTQSTVSIEDVVLSVQASQTSTSTPTSSSTRSSNTPTTTVTITPGGNSPNSQPNNSNPTSTKSSTPVGAIVGGVIGGIALVAAIAFGWWFLRRSKRTNDTSPSSQPQPQVQASPPAVTGADSRVSYYSQQPVQPVAAPAEKEHYAPQPNQPQGTQQTISEIYSPPHSPAPNYPEPVQQPYNSYPPYAEVEGHEIGPRAGPGHY